MLGQPGGDRAVRLDIAIRNYERAGNQIVLTFDATLADRKTGARLIGTSEIAGRFTDQATVVAPSIAGLIAGVVASAVIGAMRSDAATGLRRTVQPICGPG